MFLLGSKLKPIVFLFLTFTVGINSMVWASGGYGHDHDHHKTHHHHVHIAPHGGALVVFGNEFAHLEFVLEGDGELIAYALDGEAENPVNLKDEFIAIHIEQIGKEIQLAAVANPLTGEAVGKTSEFRGQSNYLRNIDHFDAYIKSITIKGRTFNHVRFSYPEGNE